MCGLCLDWDLPGAELAEVLFLIGGVMVESRHSRLVVELGKGLAERLRCFSRPAITAAGPV